DATPCSAEPAPHQVGKGSMHDETVRIRLQRFLSDERIATHFERKLILLGGEVVEDLDAEAAPSRRLVIAGS
ncbi:hypothetical protein, partial [Pseudonocardia xishanensis]|uniref:hypothetical protein n=1 Tax=Pseudonocardia xishanensis TaxID=630995 RepID=UPI0031EB1FCA